MSSRYFALIPAAGIGARVGAAQPKQYLTVANKPILRHAIDAFLASADIAGVFVVTSDIDRHIDMLSPNSLAGVNILRCGGATRRDSVFNGLNAIRNQVADNDWILVHDAARPGLTPSLIAKLIKEVGDHVTGGLLAMPVSDTVKRVQSQQVTTIARDELWLAQTPQMFRYIQLREALRLNVQATDEASAIEAAGGTPKLVSGHPCNLKVTTSEDIALAEFWLQRSKT